MTTLKLTFGAVLLAAMLHSTAAMAYFNAWTSVSGAAFHPSSGSQALPQHVAGNVINYSTSQPAIVEASLGHQPGTAIGIYVYGNNNGGALQCDVLATPEFLGGQQQRFFTATDRTNGPFMLIVNVNTIQSPNPNYFYTIRCSLPPGSTSIYGVHPFNGGSLLTPQSVAGFLPISYSPGAGMSEVSLGYYGGGQTGFVLNGKQDNGTLNCYVYAQSPTAGFYAFSASTSATGYVSLNTVATVPGGGYLYFYTMRCGFTGSFDLRGVWPGH